MNNQVFKSILPVLGVVLGPILGIASLRTFAGWVLGSGVFGAVPLAIVVVVITLATAFLITYHSGRALIKVWN